MWWSERETSYKPRDPSKTIDWSRPEGWKPKTPEEVKARFKIARLQHNEVKVGGIYQLVGKPNCKVRVWHIYNEPPQVQIVEPNSSGGTSIIFTEELEETQFNTNQARKNWVRRRAAKRRARGEFNY